MILNALFFYLTTDPIIGAIVAFYALYLIITLVQCGQVGMIMFNPVNASRRAIFGTLLGGTVCLAIA